MNDARTSLFLLLCSCGRVGFDPQTDSISDVSGADLACANGDARLLACYAFEQATTDGSGNGHDGVATTIAYTAGHAGTAILLDGTGLVDVPETATLQPANQVNVTVDAWIRIDAVPATGERFEIMDHNNGVALAVGAGATLRFAVHASSAVTTAVTAPSSITVGRWTRVTGIYDGANVTAWIDGVMSASQADSGVLVYSAPNGLRIGGNLQESVNPNPDRFVGAIDDLTLWSDAITP